MNKVYLLLLTLPLVGLLWASVSPIRAENVSPASPHPARIRDLRQEHKTFETQDLEFMVHVVFADAMNPDLWANNWIRAHRIPPVTHLTVLSDEKVAPPSTFTILTLSERANHRVVVLKGFQGFPNVRRWMSVPALSIYFQKLTTEEGEIQHFEPGFLGAKALRMGLDLKDLLDELHSRGLMRTEEVPPLSEAAKIENASLRKALGG